MDVKKAKEVQEAEERRKKDLKESEKVIEVDKIKKIQEQEEAEKLRKREEFEVEKKKYPKKAGEIYMPCWNCKNKQVNMSSGEYISKASLVKIIIVGVCRKCGSYNIAVIPTNTQTSSSHDRFLTEVNLN